MLVFSGALGAIYTHATCNKKHYINTKIYNKILYMNANITS